MGRRALVDSSAVIEPAPIPQKSPIQLVKLSELTQAIGVSAYTVRRWVKEGAFPAPLFIMDGGSARWRVRDIDGWIEKCKRKRRRPPAPRGHFKRKRLTDEGES